MRKTLLLLSCVLAAGCSSVPSVRPVEVPCPILPPPPASVMVERAPNFLSRLLNGLSASPAKPTPSPDNSPPARP